MSINMYEKLKPLDIFGKCDIVIGVRASNGYRFMIRDILEHVEDLDFLGLLKTENQNKRKS